MPKYLILFILISQTVSLNLKREPTSLSIQACWKYECSSQTDTCIVPVSSNTTYLISPCPKSKPYCDTSSPETTSYCSSVSPESTLTSYPGESCSKDSDCETGICLSSICYGKSINDACTTNFECNPGLRCSNGKCSTLQQLGSPCQTDYDCANHLGCNLGVCTGYMSLPIGSLVSDCNNGASSSMFCEESSCIFDRKKKTGTCINPFVSKNREASCTSSKDCIGESSYLGIGYTVFTTCQCGMNNDGAMFCFPNDGDSAAVEFRKWWKRFLELGYLKKCNTERRFEEECFDMSADSYFYVRMIKAYYEYYNFPQINAAPDCVVQVFYQVLDFGLILGSALWLVSL